MPKDEIALSKVYRVLLFIATMFSIVNLTLTLAKIILDSICGQELFNAMDLFFLFFWFFFTIIFIRAIRFRT